MSEPHKIYLGAIALEQGESIALDLPADLDPDAVRAAIERANLERAAAAKQETERLRQMFLNTKAAIERGDP